MREGALRKPLEIGVMPSAERDLNRLPEYILERVMGLSNCGAGTLCLLEDGKLSILEAMAEKEGKLDPRLTRLFIESRCWETPAPVPAERKEARS